MRKGNRNELFIFDIEENIEYIEEFTIDGKEEFMSSRKTRFSVMKALENIGEAVKNIEDSIKKTVPAADWRSIARTRDFLIHHYFSVSDEQIWEIVSNDLPVLKQHINLLRQEILKPEPSTEVDPLLELLKFIPDEPQQKKKKTPPDQGRGFSL